MAVFICACTPMKKIDVSELHLWYRKYLRTDYHIYVKVSIILNAISETHEPRMTLKIHNTPVTYVWRAHMNFWEPR